MGLDTTHNCWRGAYSSLHRFRTALAAAIGIQLDEMHGFQERDDMEGKPWADPETEPLIHLLDHSDCDGEIAVEVLLPLAKRLREVAPLLRYEGYDSALWERKTIQFAEGCEKAASLNEIVEFF